MYTESEEECSDEEEEEEDCYSSEEGTIEINDLIVRDSVSFVMNDTERKCISLDWLNQQLIAEETEEGEEIDEDVVTDEEESDEESCLGDEEMHSEEVSTIWSLDFGPNILGSMEWNVVTRMMCHQWVICFET